VGAHPKGISDEAHYVTHFIITQFVKDKHRDYLPCSRKIPHNVSSLSKLSVSRRQGRQFPKRREARTTWKGAELQQPLLFNVNNEENE